MFRIDGALSWSATDLTLAAECEYALLRALDDKLGRAQAEQAPVDPFMKHIGALGDRHEARLLEELRAASDVLVLEHVDGYTKANVEAARDATIAAFAGPHDVIAQAAFFDGEFFGYADFVERTPGGWMVSDAKLARSAKPKALIQLGAYADQVASLGLPLADRVSLLLGNGERVFFPTADVLPIFRERRTRLRELLATHQASEAPVGWGDDALVACGSCVECEAAAVAAKDVILVAGLRMDQRRKLRAEGITTIQQLAEAEERPGTIARATFDKVRAQARLQWDQVVAGPGAAPTYELTATAAAMLMLLPAPSPGDLFFDFEGDPLHDEGDPGRVGLEYLWGAMDTQEKYVPIWAHTATEERAAFVNFMDEVAERRTLHPDMHIYHYAPYETTALKRLAMRYQTKEKELDDLLRSEVFVDLYATVRGSVRISQPSYSIKKLEPLYMAPHELREGEVADGAGSIVAYAEYRDLLVEDPDGAQERLDDLAEYNEYDCLSTLRLRDWLLERAVEAGVRDQIVPRALDVHGEELSEDDPVFVGLMTKAGDALPVERTAEEQAYAMLATALDYFRREAKSFWWGHYERLGHPVGDWAGTRDVFVVESAEVVSGWAVPTAQSKNPRRTVRLVGDWTPGSTPGGPMQVVYESPAHVKANGPLGAPYAACEAGSVTVDLADPRVVVVEESCQPDATHDTTPIAIAPGPPPLAGNIEVAIKEVASAAESAASLPTTAVLDILARRRPRPRGGGSLPRGSSTIDDIVAALAGMDDSFLAVQGPPGTGKTYTGSRVIKRLVERHGWRIGVVAQSHAVVEHMLEAIVKAGLDPSLIGKNKTKSTDPTWTPLTKVPKFLEDHAATGCVVGGTAWDFANDNNVARGSLDLLVIDEAGQFALAPTIGASVAASRLLLLGDPQQLPQVSQVTHAEPVNESALGWLMEDHDTISANRGYFLGESYRMHPDLCAKVSTLSYDGRLQAAPPASERDLDGVSAGLRVVTIAHQGNRTESPEEADAVVVQIQDLMGRLWTEGEGATPRPLQPNDFLVVAPYNAQVALIRRRLDEANLHNVRVGTVDKFQGQESPVAIVSMTASSHGDVPRGMSFLLSRNRVNVAVSRAQWLAVLIRSEALTAYMPTSVDGVLQLGAFIGMCDGLHPKPIEANA